MKCKGLIFDFNGVLLWDSHLHEQAWQQMSRNVRGFPFSLEEIAHHVHGRTNKYIVEHLLQKSLNLEELHDLAKTKESMYQTLCLENRADFRLSPGAVELLDFVCEHNIPHTIATASNGYNLQFFIRNLGLETWFDIAKIVYDDGTFSGKRDMYVKAAGNLDLAPRECAVIEDARSGIVAAHQAGIGKIWALGPREKHTDLQRIEGVSAVISSLEEFPRGEILAITTV